MKKFLSTVKGKVLTGVAAVGVVSSNAMAAGSLTVSPLSTDDFVAVAGAVLVASSIMWGIKKGLGLIGR